jgi:hypothetical protein
MEACEPSKGEGYLVPRERDLGKAKEISEALGRVRKIVRL